MNLLNLFKKIWWLKKYILKIQRQKHRHIFQNLATKKINFLIIYYEVNNWKSLPHLHSKGYVASFNTRHVTYVASLIQDMLHILWVLHYRCCISHMYAYVVQLYQGKGAT